jgi:hypothetical protein
MRKPLPGRGVEAKNVYFGTIFAGRPRTETSALIARQQMEVLDSVEQERGMRKELAVKQKERAIIYDPSANNCH